MTNEEQFEHDEAVYYLERIKTWNVVLSEDEIEAIKYALRIISSKEGSWDRIMKADECKQGRARCSVCKYEFQVKKCDYSFEQGGYILPNYCMNCGAKMDNRKAWRHFE